MHHGLRTSRESFFRKSQTFGLGQTNWAENFWGIWGIFEELHHPSQLSIRLFFLQKTLVFRPKTYKSQINPKDNIGRKEFAK